MKKERYIALMEKALEAYSDEHIKRYFDTVKADGLTEHGFARLVSNIGILIANGKKTELTPLFVEMMDFCCREMPRVKAANDFTVKEIIFCIMALESAGLMTEKLGYWKSLLTGIEYSECYTVYATSPCDKIYNWACFTAVSEYMRQYIGLADTLEFVDLQLATQLQWLDENGMYRDPHEPTVYDLVPRGLFAVLLHFGYNGKYRTELDEALRRAGCLTLSMQSVSGEIAYGGRSNQFLHNEAQLAIVLEYEAKRYSSAGDSALAARCKQGVARALDNIELWISKQPIRHVKNRFPTESGYGCEDYAYFDKYMITVASFLYAAYLISDEEISESVQTESKPYCAVTSKHFHKIFLNAHGYFLEFDTDADYKYDASGLGRIHRQGAPSPICLSTPGTATPNYKTDVDGAVDFSVCPALVADNGLFGALRNSLYELRSLSETECCASCELRTEIPDIGEVISAYRVSENGVEITVSDAKSAASGQSVKPALMLPAFEYDGESKTEIRALGSCVVEISYGGWCCRYTAVNGYIFDTGKRGANRNGHYRIFAAAADAELTVRIEIEKE